MASTITAAQARFLTQVCSDGDVRPEINEEALYSVDNDPRAFGLAVSAVRAHYGGERGAARVYGTTTDAIRGWIAGKQAKTKAPRLMDVEIPEQYGNVILAYSAPSNHRHLVVIGTSDSYVPRVEYNTLKIYLHLASEYGMHLVGIEGEMPKQVMNPQSRSLPILNMPGHNIQDGVEAVAEKGALNGLTHPALIMAFAEFLEYPLQIKGFEHREARKLLEPGINIPNVKEALERMRRSGGVREEEYTLSNSRLMELTVGVQRLRSDAMVEGILNEMESRRERVAMLTIDPSLSLGVLGYLTEAERGTNYYFVEPHGFP